MSDKVKSEILGGMFVFAALGAIIIGRISDRIGHRTSLIGILISWTIFLPVLSAVTSPLTFVLLMSALGFLLGATWTVTRAVMAYLAPNDQTNHAFSFYTLAERFATLVGPLSWGAIATGLLHFGEVRYRAALFCMGLFVLAGLIIAWKIPPQEQLVTEESHRSSLG
jgi:MFS transporter, UMF1 family